MTKLFYTDLAAPSGIDSLSPHFILESFVPGLGVILNTKTPIVSSFFTASVTSSKDYADLAQRLAISAKGITAKTGHAVTVTLYSTKYISKDNDLKIRPFVVVSTAPRIQGEILISQRDARLSAAVEEAYKVAKKILAASQKKLTLIETERKAYQYARLAILPSDKPFEDMTILGTCLGGLNTSYFQKCVLTNQHVGTSFVRQTLPQTKKHDMTEDLFAALVSERLTPGLGCKIDSYASYTESDDSFLPSGHFQLALTEEDDGISEAISSRYIHWEKNEVLDNRFGTFMEHLAIRNLELKVLKTLAQTSESIWTPTSEHNGIALIHSFPGMISLGDSETACKHPRFILSSL
jgi:hypothetical protein